MILFGVTGQFEWGCEPA